ncbi:N-acetyl-gamma-glutamyl-phosphate reductase [Candidatus Hecatella orcuttiae]|jgi:N-acetyl-gamma-glutamyl-phosphate/LysW-gamma-L-alpha-aminoadipyl-6-phosphate reductase|uniref:N-acetyl-gamma-glutamyl-phosphate reductase n=1 Tax=Candidatus Hecatella orcuttiae TaxID=1935119 RepID=UPI002867D051|nr:N-acetyl-gamma-glutamyl-phosphate reductase [Candidatus Hecatella orcuttiae]
MLRVGVIGGSGYTGGELLRLLLGHPQVEIAQTTSREYGGEYVFRVHPNLRGLTSLQFAKPDLEKTVKECDLVFTATPHGVSSKLVPRLLEAGLKVIDLSADFRLKNPEGYPQWYGWSHPHPELLQKAVYGVPELHRSDIGKAQLVACPGCMAVASILALAPAAKERLFEEDKVVVDVKIGSSGAGAKPSRSTHHAERAGVIRPYKPTGHRHTAEIEQELNWVAGSGAVKISMSAHAVNVVRGILATAHLFLKEKIGLAEVWKAYRGFYQNEPFIRLVRDKKGLYKLPDPKTVIGSNFCDIGFDLDKHVNRLVVLGAIDNLMKGAAGIAVQNLNLMMGWDERTGLLPPALYPV